MEPGVSDDYFKASRDDEDIQGDDHEEEEEEEEEEDWKAPVMMGQDRDARPSVGVRNLHGNKDHQRTIVHIDLDCFYAQVEMIRDPSLRNKPLGIQQKNIVVTTNYVAREQNVGKLSYIKDALEKCPDLVLVSGEDLTHYRDMSYKVTEVLQRFHPVVERLGFDENYIDVSSLVEERLKNNHTLNEKGEIQIAGHLYNKGSIQECMCGCHQRLAIGSQIAKEMRDALYSELEITSCAGVAHNKLLAKLVGGQHKPNDQTMIYPEYAQQMMISLGKVRAIPGIGHSNGKKLASMGISSIQDLLDASKTVLESEFGHQQACTMKQLAQGIDSSPVVATGAPQSISDEDSFKKCSTLSNAKERMLELLQNLLKRLKSDGRVPQTVRVTVRKYSPKQWKRESRQCSLPPGLLKHPSKDESSTLAKLLDICIALFHKMVNSSKPFHLMLINICFAKLQAHAKTSSNIDSFFSPKAAGTLKKTSPPETSAAVPTIAVGTDEKSIETKKPTATMSTNIDAFALNAAATLQKSSEQKQMSHTRKVPDGTLKAFFSSPKRKKAKLFHVDKKNDHATQSSSFQRESSFTSHQASTLLDFEQGGNPSTQALELDTKGQGRDAMGLQSTHGVERETPKDLSRTLSDSNIPPNVDPDVFRVLPFDVQQELRTQYLSDLRDSNTQSSPGPINPDMTQPSYSSENETGLTAGSILTQRHEPCILTQSHEPSVGDCTISRSPAQSTSAPVSDQSSSTGETIRAPDSASTPNLSATSANATTGTSSTADVSIPSGMDPDVFAGLPSEMKQELIKEWKQGAYEISSVDLRHGAGRRSHGHAKGKSKGKKSISDYSKNNNKQCPHKMEYRRAPLINEVIFE